MDIVDSDLPKDAPVGSDNVTLKFSGPSATVSFVTGIVIVPELCPAAIVKVPLVVV